MTAKVVTWLGEDIEPPEGEDGQVTPGPSFNTWGGIRFDKDKPVLIDDQEGDVTFREMKRHILITAVNNRFYRVDDPAEHKAEPPKPPAPPKPAVSSRPGTRK